MGGGSAREHPPIREISSRTGGGAQWKMLAMMLEVYPVGARFE
jgi:hypothetical protein